MYYGDRRLPWPHFPAILSYRKKLQRRTLQLTLIKYRFLKIECKNYDYGMATVRLLLKSFIFDPLPSSWHIFGINFSSQKLDSFIPSFSSSEKKFSYASWIFFESRTYILFFESFLGINLSFKEMKKYFLGDKKLQIEKSF